MLGAQDVGIKNMFRFNEKDYSYLKFLCKLRDMGTVTTYDILIELGKYSGYPMCCVRHFSKYAEMGIVKVGLYMNTMYGKDGVGYVRCFKCRKNIYNKNFFVLLGKDDHDGEI